MTDGRPLGEDDLQAYVDGRLPPERRAGVEAYLASDCAAAAQMEAQRADRAALRAWLAPVAAEPVPARLRIAHIAAGQRLARRRSLAMAGGVAACLALGAGAGWFARGYEARATPAMAQDAFSAYRVFAVEKAHVVEVGADNESHLVQWLSRRLGRPLKAPDLTAAGLKLVGGRLLPSAAATPAAQFMYEDAAGRRASVYVRPGALDETTGFRFERQGDIGAFLWTEKNLAFAIVGQESRENLLAAAHAVYAQFSDI
ncbi:MAG: anti-sigma factor [Hyphomicrobiales bacterium]|nr:anti-sigma factor [Hyphomicrobiales bacterium]